MRISLEETIQRLKEGEVVAIPTETVYGLAAGLHHQEAIQQIFAIKGRPANNPLIIHVSTLEEIELLSEDRNKEVKDLGDAFWPGALTLVLNANQSISENVRAGLPTAAFRIPSHPLALSLLKAVGPIVAPSANLSGRPSATSPQHVEEDFGLDFPVLDGGICIRGLESTILGRHENQWEVFRLGSIPAEDFEPILGYIPKVACFKHGEIPLCPGQLFRHYAPKTHLVLSEKFVACEAIVGFSNRNYPAGHPLFNLGKSDNPLEVSHSLYDVLRQLDQREMTSAWVDMDFPKEGLWETIVERLVKASSSKV